MKTMLASLTLAAAALAAPDASAFCIYNDSKKDAEVTELYHWRGMKTRIKPGQHACCNWQNRDCNKDGKRTSRVNFQIIAGYSASGGFYSGKFCGFQDENDNPAIPLQAGGYLRIKDNPGFKKNQEASPSNPSHFVESFTYDDKVAVTKGGKPVTHFWCPTMGRGVQLKDFLP